MKKEEKNLGKIVLVFIVWIFKTLLKSIVLFFEYLWKLIIFGYNRPKAFFIRLSVFALCAGSLYFFFEKEINTATKEIDFNIEFPSLGITEASQKGNNSFGIDVSQYQGKINWSKVGTKHPVEFVICRSTMGKDRKDTQFKRNFSEAKRRGFFVGAYHYYDPNENSTLQARNFCKAVSLEEGDIHPVLDIEALGKQSLKKLKKGLRNYSDIIFKKYGIRPIIYTGQSFWNDYLKKDFSDHKLWVAAYSSKRRNSVRQTSDIHQFTEKVRISGISGNTVDGNDIDRDVFSTLIIK